MRGIVAIVLLLLACSSTPRSDGGASHTYMGRAIAPAMSYLAADWLERADREATEQPERVLDALAIAPGMTVADIGAGSGYFSVRLARRVGPTGRVIATDVQPEMVAMLKERAAREGLANLEPVLVREDDAGLPAGAVDLALMVDVYHELAQPAATMRGVRAALAAHGRLVLIEYRGEDPEVPIKPEHKMTLQQVRKELEPMGFRFVESLEFLPQQHVIVFQNGAAAAASSGGPASAGPLGGPPSGP